ncbi:carbohydrate ABC transporter permease [Bacillus sp. Marseille-P3661]|uniref:carbohydrate ABC transporter permease n=1 Tax=Bacillus sp. Marseille-P3661 TaxID=1936234 RepID=UPI000C8633F2|nr:sugar ABC transporter permease [Bacillus sp. Marseille-P3661]
MKVKKKWILIFLLPTVLFYCAIYLIPMGITIISSFSSWNGYESMKFIGLENYLELFLKDSTFKTALLNTILWAAMAAFIQVPLGVLVAFIIHKKPFGWKFVRTVFLIPNIIAIAAWAVIYAFIFNPGVGLLNGLIQFLGFTDFSHNWLYDSKTAFLSIGATWVFFAGIITLITLAELSSISPSIHEAAKIDGASDWQIDWYINLPMLKNIIGTGVILAVTSVLKKFEVIYLTTRGGPGDSTTNLTLMIYNEVSSLYRYGYGNAIGVIQLILGIILIIIISKAFRMNRGAYE